MCGAGRSGMDASLPSWTEEGDKAARKKKADAGEGRGFQDSLMCDDFLKLCGNPCVCVCVNQEICPAPRKKGPW